MKEFIVEARVHGIVFAEDAYQPAGWRGSGCYTHEEYHDLYITCTVWAACKDEAERMVKTYGYENDPRCPISLSTVEDVIILKTKEGGEDDGDDAEIEVNYV